jgi:hypothetical protein
MVLQKHWFWILILSVILTGFLWLSPQTIENFFKAKSAVGVTGLVGDVYGRVEKRAALATSYAKVSKNTDLANGDVLITHEDSKVLMTFSPSFWLLPFSKMEFVKNEDRWTGRLIYGEIRQIETAESASAPIELIYNDQRITEIEFSSSREVIVTPLVSANSETFQEIKDKESPPQNAIEKQIFQTLLLHKKFFQGCFIKHYKSKTGQVRGGETVFDLYIDVTGTIESATVTRTDINDKEYLQCLQMIFSRMRFKNFQAKEPLHALFPLQVDLP